jgi:hypothetical protein
MDGEGKNQAKVSRNKHWSKVVSVCRLNYYDNEEEEEG